jgi:uracil-DNA glycosylase family 4
MSLDLDERQRAMLQEMGVCVWLPVHVAAPSKLQPPVRDSQRPPAELAIEKIAKEPIAARPKAEFLPGKTVSVDLLAGALDAPALVQAVAACQACQLCSGRRAPVFGRPAPAQPADWLVLGEPPDEDEERAGSAFAGQAGLLLDNMLRALQLTRDTGETTTAPANRAYLSNVVKCRPAVVRIPQPQELLACEPFLQREIALVRPKVILAMGRFAAQALLQGSQPELATLPLGKLRGQTYHYQGVPVIVTYHPGYLLRSQADKARAWLDLCRAQAAVLGAAGAADGRPA